MENNDEILVKWNSYYKVEATPKELNEGDKIVLPASALEQLLLQAGRSAILPSPLTFELRHPHSGATIHCGVKEFSSRDADTAQLPSWILQSLNLSEGDHVLIKLDILPKGTFAKLQPLSNDYREIADYRAALEAHLRGHYNTLTQGQTIHCRYGGHSYAFQVLELQPQKAVSITDTDLEVDIETANVKRETVEQQTNIQLNQVISDIAMKAGEYRYWRLTTNEKHVTLQLLYGEDIDIVTSTTDKYPTLDHYELAEFTRGKLDFKDLAAEHIYIGIHAYKDSTVSWKATLLVDPNMTMMQTEEEEDRSGKVQCKNCHAWVLERTLMLHEGFCLRNNAVCPWGCGQVFKKDSQEFQDHWHCDQCDFVGQSTQREKHVDYFHTPKHCECTQFTANSYAALAQHKRTDCAEKLITCKYCHILTAQGVLSLDARDRLLGLHSHESYCGSRTITCQKCNKPIPIKDIQVHAKIHEVKRQNQVLPPSCSNRNCIRPKATNKNRLSFCQYCFGPFWITEDDPKNVKLIQRIARRMHMQLSVGCGNAWCRNKYCATSTKDLKDATTAASLLIPMIKPLARELSLLNPDPELYFCVDETTTRKKFLAELLSSESNGVYEVGWCVKAVESEQEDLDNAKVWLDRNAPRKKIIQA